MDLATTPMYKVEITPCWKMPVTSGVAVGSGALVGVGAGAEVGIASTVALTLASTVAAKSGTAVGIVAACDGEVCIPPVADEDLPATSSAAQLLRASSAKVRSRSTSISIPTRSLLPQRPGVLVGLIYLLNPLRHDRAHPISFLSVYNAVSHKGP